MHAYIHIYIHICVCVCVCVCIYIYITQRNYPSMSFLAMYIKPHITVYIQYDYII